MELTIIGWVACPIISVAMGWIIANLRRNNTETKALKDGMQSLLRDRLLQCYRYHEKEGFANYESRQNFEALYNAYKGLNGNGIITDIRSKFLALPTHKEESKNEN